jgi:hypothetical protein
MKALTTTFRMLILTLLVFNNSMAQKASFTPNGGLTIGFGGGKTYQKSDLANSNGLGFDFILGSQIYYKENAFVSVDWKFRFLAGDNKAYDLNINSDNTVSNIRYSFFSYDLELGLTLNRLRERTRIVLTGFAGAGITHGRTFMDIYDAGNNLYDYSSIDPDRDRKLVYEDLVALSDGNFETHLLNKAAILPTAGLFFGYQFSRSITAGIEFKTNFYLTEKNSLVGINLDNRVIAGSSIDRNNYVSLGLKWTLRGRSSYNNAANNYSHNETNDGHSNIVSTQPSPNTSVLITDPTADSYHTFSNTHTIWATVKNVSGPDNINFYQNEFPNNSFSYNTATKIFIANVNLREGENRFRINATNQTSSDEDFVTITLDNPPEAIIPAPEQPPITYQEPVYQEPVYQEPVYQEPVYQEPVYQEPVYHQTVFRSPPPVINITSPVIYPLRTFKGSEELQATVLNVNSKENITLNINGLSTRNFNFSNSTKVLTVRVALREGNNVLTIQAQNESGGDTKDQVFIKETRPCPQPLIRLIEPIQGQSSSSQQNHTVRAEVRNIAHSNQLRLTANGNPVSFSFNNNILSSQVPLTSGLNTLSLKATNECGEDNASARISYSPSAVINPCTLPKATFTLNEVNRNDATHELRGSISGVNNRADISVTVDGKADNGFQFVPPTGELSAKFKLPPGSHTIVVSANNDCGTDKQDVNVNIKRPCTLPKATITLHEVNRNDVTHELRGSISGVNNRADITLTVDGKADNGFQFVPPTGELSAKFKLPPGSHTIVVSVNNDCGTDSKSESVNVDEVASGIRINPGNSTWQFCMVTPSGTFSRDKLTNANFSYSGPASSLYIMPIGGGGDAMVNGRPYPIKSGQYYLFTGILNVTVSTKNPGSMGQWSVCIGTDRAPVSGNGNNRPKSPCEVDKDDGIRGNSANYGNNGNRGSRGNR